MPSTQQLFFSNKDSRTIDVQCEYLNKNETDSNMDEKLGNELTLALETAESDREASLNLNLGYDKVSDEWELIVKYNGELAIIAEELGVRIIELINEYAIIYAKEESIPRLLDYAQIEYIEKPKPLVLQASLGRAASCVNEVQYGAEGLLGEGVIIGIIDSGIDYAHPDFLHEDGTTRILFLWDQTGTENSPAKYGFGAEYTSEIINEALRQDSREQRLAIVPEEDISGHGTFVTGIASGNGRASEGRIVGVAPRAELIIVKVAPTGENSFPRTTQMMTGLSYIVDKAIELNQSVAINVSFGTNYGSHDGRSILDTYIDDIANYWKSAIIIGTGNEGASGKHYYTNISGADEVVEFEIAEGTRSINLQIWKNFVDSMGFSVISPQEVEQPINYLPGERQTLVFGSTRLLIYYGTPSPYSISEEIYIEFISNETYIDSGIWKIRVIPERIVQGDVDMWLPAYEISGENTRFLEPAVNTTLTIPSTAYRAISVGAYNSFNDSVADFSGRGYTRNNLMIKPDLVAPGVDIISAAPGGGYSSKSGTSMATPFVTGAAALMMEWGIVRGNDSFLYGEKVKAYLIRGARQLRGRNTYPNPMLGWGALCLRESLPG